MSKLEILIYRLTTLLQAFHDLYNLDQRDIDAFMNSYVLFDGDWSRDNGKRESHIVDYYRVLNLLCALGNVEKMYIPPIIELEAGVFGNQVLFEQKMCADLGLQRGWRVLDIGCGRGRVAHHVAAHTGSHVTGLNIDPFQLENARQFTQKSGRSNCCAFVQGSLNETLPFPDKSFDAAYQIQAFTFARDRAKVYSELYRVMRPGAKFSYLDWVVLPGYDPSNPHHGALLDRTRFVVGGVDAPSPEDEHEHMRAAGFEILFSGDVSAGGHQSALIKMEDKYFNLVRRFVEVMVRVRAFPRHFQLLFERFVKDADAFIESDELGLATTSYQIIARKPAAPTAT